MARIAAGPITCAVLIYYNNNKNKNKNNNTSRWHVDQIMGGKKNVFRITENIYLKSY